MAAITDATYYTNQTGSDGDSVVKTYPKDSARVVHLPPIVRNMAGTESAADTFNLIRLQPGQILRSDLSTITHDDCGTTLTIDIGDAGDADRYANGFDLATAAGTEFFTAPAIPDAVPNPYEIVEANKDVVVTIATASSPSAGDVIFNLVIEQNTGDRFA